MNHNTYNRLHFTKTGPPCMSSLNFFDAHTFYISECDTYSAFPLYSHCCLLWDLTCSKCRYTVLPQIKFLTAAAIKLGMDTDIVKRIETLPHV